LTRGSEVSNLALIAAVMQWSVCLCVWGTAFERKAGPKIGVGLTVSLLKIGLNIF